MSCFFFLEQEEKSEKIGDPIRTNIYVPSPDEATQWDFKVRTYFSASTFFKGISEEYFIVHSDKNIAEKMIPLKYVDLLKPEETRKIKQMHQRKNRKDKKAIRIL